MDFKSCFIDGCMPCNSFCQSFNSSTEILGQGDCKDRINLQEQHDWEREKILRNKFWEKVKLEKQKKFLNIQCNCPHKNTRSEEISDQISPERKLKNNTEILKSFSIPWDSSYANWSNNKIKKSEEPRIDSESDKLSNPVILDLKEKVEFLYTIFKDYGQNRLKDNGSIHSHGYFDGITIDDVLNLFNINKRLSIAEKGIQKLTLILENFLKESKKKKTTFPNGNSIFSEPLNFEEMSITQRINFLKSRNDFLFNFMRDFLKVHSVDELYSRMDLLPNDCDSNRNSKPPSSYNHSDENEFEYSDREEIIETLKQLRLQLDLENEDPCENYNEIYPKIQEKAEMNSGRFFRNKLEVISEQAELSLCIDQNPEISNELKKNNIRHLKGKFSEIKQESTERDSNISEKTAKLLAQEAMLKSSLDKAHFEIFSKPDPFTKNLTSNSNTRTNLTISIPRETENNEEGSETSLDSLSCICCENEDTEKFKTKETGKCPIQEEYKKEIKQDRNYETMPSSLPKPNSIRRTNKRLDVKNNVFPREETKNEFGYKEQRRPMTTPGINSKSLNSSGVKPLVPEKNRKKFSGNKNVKNKNKLLLSEKSCVHTA